MYIRQQIIQKIIGGKATFRDLFFEDPFVVNNNLLVCILSIIN